MLEAGLSSFAGGRIARRGGGAGAVLAPAAKQTAGARIDALSGQAPLGLKIRIHGDYPPRPGAGDAPMTIRPSSISRASQGHSLEAAHRRKQVAAGGNGRPGCCASFQAYVQPTARCANGSLTTEAEAARLAPLGAGLGRSKSRRGHSWSAYDAAARGTRSSTRPEALQGRRQKDWWGLFELETALYELALRGSAKIVLAGGWNSHCKASWTGGAD